MNQRRFIGTAKRVVFIIVRNILFVSKIQIAQFQKARYVRCNNDTYEETDDCGIANSFMGLVHIY